MKRCMYCGNENDDSSQNCSKCGNHLMDMPPQQAMQAEEVPEDGSIAEETALGMDAPDIKISEEGLDDGQPMEQGMPYGQEAAASYGEQGYPWQQDVQRGQTYAAQQQPYSGQPYGYAQNTYEQPDVQQQYGGQAYGYQQPTQQYGQPTPPQGGYDYGRVQPMGNGGGQQLMMKARKMVKSPLFFLVVLLNTAAVVSSIINILGGNVVHTLNAFQALLQSALGSSMAVSFFNGIIDLVEGLSSGIIVAAGGALSLPGVLICLGLWLTFLLTKRNGDEISTVGYTMTKVMVLLEFIGLCLLLTAGLIISVAFVVAAGASSSTTSIIVGIILLIIMIIISAVMVLFYVQFLHCIKVIKLNAKNGADPGRIAVFVPVMGILSCIFTILMMLPMSPDDILGLVSQGTSAAWILFGSIWLLAYRAKVRR